MKLPFAFNFKFVFRLLLPGFITALGLLPALLGLSTALGVNPGAELLLTAASLILGWLFVVLDMPIYQAAEGRRFWFGPLARLGRRREQRRVERLWRQMETAWQRQDSEGYLERSQDLLAYPFDDQGDLHARYPSRVGNLLAAYETYPQRVYGLDAVFFWPRLWLLLDNETREELDNQQALVDSTLYSAVALKLCALAGLGYALIQGLGLPLLPDLPEWPWSLGLGLLAALAGQGLYRISLPLHAAYGESFKALFDIHRDKLDRFVEDVILGIAERTADSDLLQRTMPEKYKLVYMFLQHNRLPDGRGGWKKA